MNENILRIDHARIIFRNFSGSASKFNREGDRNFCVVIDDSEFAKKLTDDGWNIKVRPPREDDGDPFRYLPVKVKFSAHGPKVYLTSGKRMKMLDESSIGDLDELDIENVDLDIRPYDWEVNGKTGRTAYLQAISVVQRLDRFAERFVNREDPEMGPQDDEPEDLPF